MHGLERFWVKTMRNNITVSSSDMGNASSPSLTQNSISLFQYNEVPSKLVGNSRYSEVEGVQQSGIFAVAQWFLHRESMSHKKLQKMCYYAYAWFLVFFNDPECLSGQINTLCPTGFEAWVHGPVCPELYQYYRVYGWNDIPAAEKQPSFSSDVDDLLSQVWKTYGSFTADQLEQLTHNEIPWQKARAGKNTDEPSNNKIDDMIIFDFYSKMMTQ